MSGSDEIHMRQCLIKQNTQFLVDLVIIERKNMEEYKKNMETKLKTIYERLESLREVI